MSIFKKKPGPRMVKSDDFKIVVINEGGEEEEIYPHYGEAVWFKNKPTVAQFNEFVNFQNTFQSVSADEEGAKKFLGQLMILADILEQGIVKWNWTNDDNELLPEKPTAETISDLSIDEISWLMIAYSGSNPAAAEERKKE